MGEKRNVFSSKLCYFWYEFIWAPPRRGFLRHTNSARSGRRRWSPWYLTLRVLPSV